MPRNCTAHNNTTVQSHLRLLVFLYQTFLAAADIYPATLAMRLLLYPALPDITHTERWNKISAQVPHPYMLDYSKVSVHNSCLVFSAVRP